MITTAPPWMEMGNAAMALEALLVFVVVILKMVGMQIKFNLPEA